MRLWLIKLIRLNLFIEGDGAFRRLHAQFFIQGGSTSFVLPQRFRPVTQQIVQAHQPLVRALAPPVVAHNAHAV